MVKELTIKHTLNCDPAKARSYFEDFSKFSSFHPLFLGIEHISGNTYMIKERMVGAPMFKFKYRAEIDTDSLGVRYKAYPFMMILELQFRFLPGTNSSECIIDEKVTITGPGMIGSFLGKVVGKMHPKLIAKMNATLKNG